MPPLTQPRLSGASRHHSSRSAIIAYSRGRLGGRGSAVRKLFGAGPHEGRLQSDFITAKKTTNTFITISIVDNGAPRLSYILISIA